MSVIGVTPLTATELADHLAEQLVPLKELFESEDRNTAHGARVLYGDVEAIVIALRAGEIDTPVALVRMLRPNRRAAFWGLKRIDTYEIF